MFRKKAVPCGVKAFALMISIMFLCSAPAQICFAIEPLAVTDSGAVTQEPPQEPGQPADAVSTFAELSEWMKSHTKSGGAARLTNDIELPADERYIYSGWANSPTLNIDVGEHTIYVSGHLELRSYLAFSGKGGENGIFHVKQGGYLDLIQYNNYDVLSVRAEEGYAIYQEDGAFFGCYTDDISGKIRYSALPVAWPFSDISEFDGHVEDFPVTLLPLKGEIDRTDFPQTTPSRVCENGKYSYDAYDLPVSWNFEKFEEQLAARERFVITGEYMGAVTAMVPPACLVTFLREDAAVFLQCSADRIWGDKLVFEMRIKLDDPSMEHRLEWSTDGELWQRAKEEEIDDEEAEGDGYWFEWGEEYDGAIKYDGVFHGTELPRYFSIATTDAAGRTTYSDTVYLDGDGKVAGWDNGGGRGGETNPGDPEDGGLPPITLPPPSETLPPSGNEGGDGDTHDREKQETDKPEDEPEKPESLPEVPPPEIPPPEIPPPEIPLSAEPLPEAETHTPRSASPGTSAESPSSEQSQPDNEADTAPMEQLSAEAVDAKPASSESASDSDTKTRQAAAAAATIALIGAPVYLAPVRKMLWKCLKLCNPFK